MSGGARACLAWLVCFSICQVSLGTTYPVACCDFDALANAIAAAGTGDTVAVAAGMYVYAGAASLVTLPVTVTGGVAISGSVGAVVNLNGAAGFLNFTSAAPVTITNLNITNGFRGAALTFALGGSPSTATLTACSFYNNTGNSVTVSPGAIAVSAGNVTLSGCTFVGNTGYSGGAINAAAGANSVFNVIGCTFSRNAVLSSAGDPSAGGAIRATSPLTIDSTTFVDNSASAHGGAVKCFSAAAALTVTNSVFLRNVAPNAGALYLEGPASFTNTNWTSNIAQTDGGAIFGTHASIAFNGCTAQNNVANTGSGGVARFNAGGGTFLTVGGSNFFNNVAPSGGCFSGNVSVTASSSTFGNNSASSTSNGGGVLWPLLTSALSTFTACTFRNNTSQNKAGVAYQAAVSVSSSTFLGNMGASGGGVFSGGSVLLVSSSIFVANSVTKFFAQGGAISDTQVVSITGSSFSGNRNLCSDGAVLGGLLPSLVVLDTSFTANSAQYDCGVMRVTSMTSNIVFQRSNFTNNRANGRSAVLGGCYAYALTVTDSLFVGNTGGPGGAIYNPFGSSQTNVYNSSFVANYGSCGAFYIVNGFLQDVNITGSPNGAITFYGNLVLQRGVFSYNTAGQGAVFIPRSASFVTATGVTFIGNSATSNGGVFADNGNALKANFTGCTFRGNLATTNGAVAISSVGSGTSLWFTDSTFAASTGTMIYSGAALDVRLSNVTVTYTNQTVNAINGVCTVINSAFTGCGTANNGGCLACNTMTVTGSTFTACSATGSGGAIQSGLTGIISNTTFSNCRSSNGGALSIVQGGTATGCVFISNTAGNGGAIYLSGKGQVINSTFTGSSAISGGGGAIYGNAVPPVTISGCSFTSNSASGNGGVIFGYNMTLSSVTSSASRAGTNGGFLYVTYPTLSNVIITISSATGGTGGGIYVSADSTLPVISMADVTITSSTAFTGGGIGFVNSGGGIPQVGTVRGLTLRNCQSAGNGGGLYQNMNTGSINVSDSTISDCTAGGNGGGVYIATSSLTGVNLSVKGNSAGNGGGVATSAANIAFDRSTIQFNRATTNGGGMYITSSTYNLTGNTSIACNAAGSGGSDAIHCIGSQANVDPSVQIAGTGAGSLVACSTCTGTCANCGVGCQGACSQSSATCSPTNMPCSSCQANLGCPLAQINQTCKVQCNVNTSMVNPAVTVPNNGNITCLDAYRGWTYANACILCPPHTHGPNCLADPFDCPATNGSAYAGSCGCPAGYDGDYCYPVCNATARPYFALNASVSLPLMCDRTLGRWNSLSPPCVVVPFDCSPLVASVPLGIAVGCPAGYAGENCSAACAMNFTMGYTYGVTPQISCSGPLQSWTPYGPLCTPCAPGYQGINCSTLIPNFCTGASNLGVAASLVGGCNGMVGQRCSYACSVGYANTTALTTTCLSTGLWSSVPACFIVPNFCANGTTRGVNTALVGICNGTVGQVCNYACLTGYANSSALAPTCLPTANWTSMPTCTAIQNFCPGSAGLGVKASVSGICNGTIGQTCFYACQTGYANSSALTTTCLSSTSWSATPTCTAIQNFCPGAAGLGVFASLVGGCNGTVGSTCLYTCLPGYANSSALTTTCQTSALWSSTPTCTIIPNYCPNAASRGINAVLAGGCAGTVGLTCGYSCLPGHGNNSALTATCQTSATWSSTPTCAACGGNCANCSSPGVCTSCQTGWVLSPACTTANTCPALSNGVNFTSSCDSGLVPLGGTCLLTCNSDASVNQTLSCVAYQTWSAFNLNCPPVSCPALTTVPSHATLGSCGVVRFVGATCALGCQDGYSVSNNATGTCSLTGPFVGAWTGQTIICTPVSCAPVTAGLPANAVQGTCGSGFLGTSCLLSCGVNFAATNSTPGVCTATTGPNAAWLGMTTTCVVSACGTVTSASYPLGGNAGNCSVGNVGNICFLGCNNGYNATTSTKGVCTNGSPSAWIGMSITCNPASCKAANVTSFANALIGSCTGGGALGDSCSFGCAVGYQASATTPGTCSPTGPGAAAWTGQSVICVQTPCPTFTDLPVSAAVGNCTLAAQGSTCLLSCASGFVISNRRAGTCVAAGATAQWTGANITCTPASCAGVTGLAANVLGGTCTGGAALGSSCLLTCQDGYVPSNVVAGTCSPAGVGAASWTGQNITCTPAACPALTGFAFPNTIGSCGAGMLLGTTCNLGCANGYAPGTNSAGACQACGPSCAQWQGASLTCNLVQCTAPSLAGVPHAVAGSCGVGNQGDMCVLDCAAGYIPSGAATATCSACAGACTQWTPLTITCTAALCPAPSPPVNAMQGSCVNNAGIGAVCNFSCSDGFTATAISQGSCQGTTGPKAAWVGQSITCSPVPCAPLIGLTSGRTAGSCTTQVVGTTCTMGCLSGYSASAATTGTCQPALGGTAVWVNASIVCTPAYCAPVSAGSLPPHATAGTCNSTQVLGSSCALDCQYGYANFNNASFSRGICNGTGPGAASWAGMDILCLPPGACVTVNSTVFGPFGTPGNCTNQPNGTACQLGCINGYVPSGVTTGVCNNFNWGGLAITCTAASCAPATAPLNGLIGSCGAGSQGATCSLACNDGYIGSGAVQGTCTADAGPSASWKNQALTCSPATCAAVTGLIGHALVGTCTSRTLGATCLLACANGYNATSSRSGVCAAGTGPTAVWTNQTIVCSPASCAPLTPPSNALVGTCGTAVLGSTCDLDCIDGYVDSGAQSGNCVAGAAATAVWTDAVIVCSPASCSAFLPSVANSTVGTCISQTLGSTCSLGCSDGFTTSASVGTCVAGTGPTALWTGLSVTCVAATCSPVTSYPSQATPGSCSTATLGASCALGCNNGYIPSGVVQGTCTPTGPGTAAWQSQTVVCTAAQCPAVVPPSGALVGSCGVGNLGSTCQMTCAPGYATSGLTAGTCTGLVASAAWLTPTITCSPASCSAATVPSHAILNTCGLKSLFSTCTLDCVNGYQATTIGHGVCSPTVGANAQWVNATITCLAVGTVCFAYTDTLPANANAGTCLTAAIGATCALDCNAGYIPTALPGTCILDSGALFPTWHNLSVSCTPASCVPVTSLPAHATAGSCTSQLLGSTCSLSCANGYVPTGSQVGTCSPGVGPTAIWSGQTVSCPAASCDDATSFVPANGNIGNCQSARLDSTCNLACNDGTSQSGEGSLVCAPGQGPTAIWSVQEAITCTALRCAALQALPSNAQAGTCTTGDLGATCQITCADGYNLTSNTPGTCQPSSATTVSWQGASGTCTPVDCDVLVELPENAVAGTCGATAALGATCQLACAEGFVSQSASPGVCTAATGANATWQGQVITCTAPAITGAGALTATAGSLVQSPTGSSSGGLIGGIVGALAVVIILVVILLIVLAKRRKPAKKQDDDPDATNKFVATDSTRMFDANATHLLSTVDDSQMSSLSSNPAFQSAGSAGSGGGSGGGSNMDATNLTHNNSYNFASMDPTTNLPTPVVAPIGLGSVTNMTAFSSSRQIELNINVDDAAALKTWDAFTVVRDLGVGNVGPVILVRENSTYTEMAYKVYRKIRTPELVAAFQKQASTVMGLHNQYVTACFGVMKHDDDIGLLVEFMAGGALNTLAPKLKPAKKIAHLADACKGLAYIHTRNLVHGNVKPGNILIDAHGTTKLADFGMNCGESDGETYAAPEVLQGLAHTAASDVYMMGLTIGEIFIGRPPFMHVAGMRRMIANAQPWENMEALPANVRAVVDRCIEIDAVRRLTATEIIEALNGKMPSATDPNKRLSMLQSTASLPPMAGPAPPAIPPMPAMPPMPPMQM